MELTIERCQLVVGIAAHAGPKVALEELGVLVGGLDVRLNPAPQLALCGALVGLLGRLISDLGATDAHGIAQRFLSLAASASRFEDWLKEFRDLVDCCLEARPHRVGHDSAARRVLDLIDREYSSAAFGLQVTATKLRLSLSHTSRLVKQETGDTFTVHLRRRRVRAAQVLLRQTPLTMKEIATAAGFGDASTFSRQFRQAVGMTPSAFRIGSR